SSDHEPLRLLVLRHYWCGTRHRQHGLSAASRFSTAIHNLYGITLRAPVEVNWVSLQIALQSMFRRSW
ncbi:MAG: hypothetical protein M0008_11060, partial [Actinomycetota bacterium]|nr:hypothetical protein [Actinomycetota bacterium]